MWIERDISAALTQNTDAIQVLRGPRQVGKSSLLLRLDSRFDEVSLDDSALRELAQSDPELFLRQFLSSYLLIDEAQYAPALFPALKRRIDLHKRSASTRETLFRVTGSNQILMDRNIKESLAGRASFFDLNTLSVSEILRSADYPIQEILYQGGWPEIYAYPGELDVKKYLDDYIQSYVEKDIVLAAGIQKSREFLKFLRLLAGRVGELLDLARFGNEVGVDGKTAKAWVLLLERMHIVALLYPFSSNLTQRLIKSPKLFFIDTGLACRLQGWSSALPILTSPQQGHLFENLVFSELYKMNINYQLGWNLFHWRSREGEEIDFLVQLNSQNFLAIEAKVSPKKLKNFNEYPEIKKVFGARIPPRIVCHQEGDRILGDQVPIARLKEYLLTTL